MRFLSIVCSAALAFSGCAPEKPVTTPSASTVIGGPGRDPLWTVQLPKEVAGAKEAVVVGEHVVLTTRAAVVVMDRRTGATRWQHPLPRVIGDGAEYVYVADDAVVEFDGFPSSAAKVYDLATGRLRFEVPDVRDRAVPARDALLVAECPYSKPCSLRAHDLRTGGRMWLSTLEHTPAPAQYDTNRVEKTFALPSRLDRTLGKVWAIQNESEDLIEPLRAVERGLIAVRGGDQAWTVDARSGAVISKWRADGVHADLKHTSYVFGDLLLDVPDENRPGGETRVFDARKGVQLWHRVLSRKTFRAGSWSALSDGPPSIVDGLGGPLLLCMTADERPQVIDLASGAVRWTGGEGAILLGAQGSIAVVRDRGGRGDLLGLVALTGQKRWAVPLPVSAKGDRYRLTMWAVHGGRLIFSGDRALSGEGETETHVVDLATGGLLWSADRMEPVGVGSDWIVTAYSPAAGQSTIRYYGLLPKPHTPQG